MVKDRIRALREQRGRSQRDMAESMGISVEDYCDLEAYDGEFWGVVSIREIRSLCHGLAVAPNQLIGGDEPPSGHTLRREASRKQVARNVICDWGSLAKLIVVDAGARRLSIVQWSEAAGWDVSEFLKDPETGWEWTVDWLRDVSQACNVDWETLLRSLCTSTGQA